VADPSETLRASVRDVQARRPLPKAGQLWRRGIGFLLVLEGSRGGVQWVNEDGTIEREPVAEWRSLAVDPIPFDPEQGDYLTHAWMIASASAIDASIRVTTLGRIAKRAPDEGSRTQVLTWIGALQRGRKPRKSA